MIKGVVLKYDYRNLSLPITKMLPIIQLLLSDLSGDHASYWADSADQHENIYFK